MPRPSRPADRLRRSRRPIGRSVAPNLIVALVVALGTFGAAEMILSRRTDARQGAPVTSPMILEPSSPAMPITSSPTPPITSSPTLPITSGPTLPITSSPSPSSPAPSSSTPSGPTPNPTGTPAKPALTACQRIDPASSPPRPELTKHPARAQRTLRPKASGIATRIRFVNDRPTPVLIRWIDDAGTQTLIKRLGAGQAVDVSTFVTHPWAVTNPGGVTFFVVVAAAPAGCTTIT